MASLFDQLSGFGEEEDQMELLRGFRFHPTDEELITHFLYKKVLDTTFCTGAIGEVELNKVEPWDLPWKSKMGEREWYFFCARDKKYPTGLRTNRATGSGYWKATGKDKEIFGGKSLVGMKKTLVFYKGRTPTGERTVWTMHEYRLEGKFSVQHLPKTAKNEFVICKVFHKSSIRKKIHMSGSVRPNSGRKKISLMDHSSPYGDRASPAVSESVDMFSSNPVDYINNLELAVSPNASDNFSRQDQASWGDSTCWSMGSLEPSEN